MIPNIYTPQGYLELLYRAKKELEHKESHEAIVSSKNMEKRGVFKTNMVKWKAKLQAEIDLVSNCMGL